MLNKIQYSNRFNFYGRTNKKNKLIQPTNGNLKKILGSKNLELLQKIYNTAKQNDMDIFLFGGAVRDCLLGKTAEDLDIIVNGKAIDFAITLHKNDKHIFKSLFIKPTVNRATVYTCSSNIDINSLAESGEKVLGKTKIKTSLLNNIKNRDFTINTMVVQLLEDKNNNLKLKFIDLLQSKKDLKENKLKIVNRNSVKDDPIRALRGIRFKIKYKMKTDSQTNSEIKNVLNNPVNKKNFYYYRLFREYFRIIKTFLLSLIK